MAIPPECKMISFDAVSLITTQSVKRHLQDVLPRQARHLAKTSRRCPKDVLNANLKDIFVRHLEETLAR